MKYQYTITTNSGTADGTIEATDVTEAREKLEKLYAAPYKDAAGKTHQNHIVKLDLIEMA